MKYKVGDKSLNWYNENKNIYGDVCLNEEVVFVKEMSNYCGQIMIISDIGSNYYLLLGIPYTWTDYMFEGLAEEENFDLTERGEHFIEDAQVNKGEISDGYHTFNELYEYRMLYNASMFNKLANQGLYDVHKSKRHSDGEIPFGDSNWFIVMAELPTGQISNHYEMKDWDLFQIPEKEKANVWDGHTPKDVAERIREFLTPKPKYPTTYEECCFELEYIPNTDKVVGYKYNILQALQELLICRDAYWKIAGEEMGLGKSWEYDCTKGYYTPAIIYRGGFIQKVENRNRNAFLSFPTAEMRDTFYEEFKELIEECKELL